MLVCTAQVTCVLLTSRPRSCSFILCIHFVTYEYVTAALMQWYHVKTLLISSVCVMSVCSEASNSNAKECPGYSRTCLWLFRFYWFEVFMTLKQGLSANWVTAAASWLKSEQKMLLSSFTLLSRLFYLCEPWLFMLYPDQLPGQECCINSHHGGEYILQWLHYSF